MAILTQSFSGKQKCCVYLPRWLLSDRRQDLPGRNSDMLPGNDFYYNVGLERLVPSQRLRSSGGGFKSEHYACTVGFINLAVSKNISKPTSFWTRKPRGDCVCCYREAAGRFAKAIYLHEEQTSCGVRGEL